MEKEFSLRKTKKKLQVEEGYEIVYWAFPDEPHERRLTVVCVILYIVGIVNVFVCGHVWSLVIWKSGWGGTYTQTNL